MESHIPLEIEASPTPTSPLLRSAKDLDHWVNIGKEKTKKIILITMDSSSDVKLHAPHFKVIFFNTQPRIESSSSIVYEVSLDDKIMIS